jgi:hypothetical protein
MGLSKVQPGHQVHLDVCSKDLVQISTHSFSRDTSGAGGMV